MGTLFLLRTKHGTLYYNKEIMKLLITLASSTLGQYAYSDGDSYYGDLYAGDTYAPYGDTYGAYASPTDYYQGDYDTSYPTSGSYTTFAPFPTTQGSTVSPDVEMANDVEMATDIPITDAPEYEEEAEEPETQIESPEGINARARPNIFDALNSGMNNDQLVNLIDDTLQDFKNLEEQQLRYFNAPAEGEGEEEAE